MEELVFSRNEPSNWLYNSKWSNLKSGMYKQHKMDSACTYMHKAIVIKEKETTNLRGSKWERVGEGLDGRKGRRKM